MVCVWLPRPLQESQKVLIQIWVFLPRLRWFDGILKWSPRLRWGKPHLLYHLTCQKHDLLPSGAQEIQRRLRDAVSVSLTLKCMRIIESLLKCRFWFSTSGMEFERWGLCRSFRGDSFSSQKNCVVKLACSPRRTMHQVPPPKPFVLRWGPKMRVFSKLLGWF